MYYLTFKKGIVCEYPLSNEDSGCCHADHFVIFSKKNTLPLVAFGLKQVKDPKSGEMVDRWIPTCPYERS